MFSSLRGFERSEGTGSSKEVEKAKDKASHKAKGFWAIVSNTVERVTDGVGDSK